MKNIVFSLEMILRILFYPALIATMIWSSTIFLYYQSQGLLLEEKKAESQICPDYAPKLKFYPEKNEYGCYDSI